jgi:sigma-54 dependent transcriptional regulator, acetoin dehydrogenase operon transcriptional activator AcoR
MPLDLQATLLRVVEQKKLMRLGGNNLIDIDVKIVSATNANIPEMIEKKQFRADLYYRLSTVSLNIPPLRERGDDIILLAEHFIRSISKRIGKDTVMALSPQAKQLLLSLPWKGNVRELQNLMECLVQLYDTQVITPEQILENTATRQPSRLVCTEQRSYIDAAPPAESFMPHMPTVHKALTENEILHALQVCAGNRSAAARYLGIARKTLYRNMERLQMETENSNG